MFCMDATHSTNMYNFLLITVLVFHDFGEGVPVAWAISNREDADTLSLFMKYLKVTSGELNPTSFMSDDANQYWNAIYGSSGTKKILCAWHVDRAW